MSKFSANNASTSGNFISKDLKPGTHYCKIVGMSIETVPYDVEQYQLKLVLQGPDQPEGFEGFKITKEGTETYKGQVAFVSIREYPFKNWGKGKDIETQIFDAINYLAKDLGILETMQKDNVSGEDVESYLENCKKYFINDNLWAYYSIGGKEWYKDGSQYPNYNLFLIYEKGSGKRSVSLDIENDKFLKFDENNEKHLKKAKNPNAETKAKEVDEFGEEENDLFGAEDEGDPFLDDRGGDDLL